MIIVTKIKNTLCIFLGAVFLCAEVIAEQTYAVNLQIERIRTSGEKVFFATTPKPAHTCSNWGEYFAFDATTVEGVLKYNMLLSAKRDNRLIQLWYEKSTAPGTDQSNGCNASTISRMNDIGIN